MKLEKLANALIAMFKFNSLNSIHVPCHNKNGHKNNPEWIKENGIRLINLDHNQLIINCSFLMIKI